MHRAVATANVNAANNANAAAAAASAAAGAAAGAAAAAAGEEAAATEGWGPGAEEALLAGGAAGLALDFELPSAAAFAAEVCSPAFRAAAARAFSAASGAASGGPRGSSREGSGSGSAGVGDNLASAQRTPRSPRAPRGPRGPRVRPGGLRSPRSLAGTPAGTATGHRSGGGGAIEPGGGVGAGTLGAAEALVAMGGGALASPVSPDSGDSAAWADGPGPLVSSHAGSAQSASFQVC